MKIAFIGVGNMGEAMLSAMLARRPSALDEIIVSDIREERRLYLKKQYSVSVTSSNVEAVAGSGLVVLAVKPQTLPEVMAEISGWLKPGQLVLSIVAGAAISTLSQGLKHERIVRAMPNTPAQIGEGITVWTATAGVSDEQKEMAAAALGAMGREIYVEDEGYIDMATAVSGSGPAYFFLVMEALTDGAVEIGLPREIAQQLVLQTMLGAGRLVQKTGEDPAELRRMVTSPGGTTAEALIYLGEAVFPRLLAGAVRAAYNKAKQLGATEKAPG